LLLLPQTVVKADVDHLHDELVFLISNLDTFHLDNVRQPALEGALHQKLVAIASASPLGIKTICRKPHPEIGPVDALAGIGEQHLINHVPYVVIDGCRCRPTSAVKMEGWSR
jgi:hypothetical protein